MAKSQGKLVALFLILISVVAVSGCVIPWPQQAGKGVEITSFAFSPSSIYGGDQTFLTLTMQNQGSIDTSKVYVFLWGFSDDWEGTNIRLEGPEKNPFSLTAPKPDLNMEGQEEKISWALTSPELPKDLPFTFTGGARVCYSYKTTASARVEIYAQEEWLRLRGQISKKPISFSQSTSPLQISVVGEQPLIASASNQIQLQITVKNVGSGTVTTTTCDAFEEGLTVEKAESLNQLGITIGGAGGGSVSCTLDEPTLFLRKGESGKILATCSLQNIVLEPIATRDIAIELSYQYYVDTQQTVSVMGTTTGLIAPKAVYSCQTVCTNNCASTSYEPTCTQVTNKYLCDQNIDSSCQYTTGKYICTGVMSGCEYLTNKYLCDKGVNCEFFVDKYLCAPPSTLASPASDWCSRTGAGSDCKVVGFNYKLAEISLNQRTCFESNIYQYLGLISLEGTLTESVCGSNCYCYGLKENCKAAGTSCDSDLMLCVGTETTPTSTCPTSSAECTANKFWGESIGSYATCGSCKTACTNSTCETKKTMNYTYTDTCCIPQTGGYNCWCGLVK